MCLITCSLNFSSDTHMGWYTGFYGSSLLSFLRYLHTNFYSGHTCLYFHQQYIMGSCSPHPYQHLLFVFLIIAILTGVRWNVILICIFFMAKEVEHFFMNSLTNYITLQNYLIHYIQSLILGYNFLSSLYII
jgi:hypothetical protein